MASYELPDAFYVSVEIQKKQDIIDNGDSFIPYISTCRGGCFYFKVLYNILNVLNFFVLICYHIVTFLFFSQKTKTNFLFLNLRMNLF